MQFFIAREFPDPPDVCKATPAPQISEENKSKKFSVMGGQQCVALLEVVSAQKVKNLLQVAKMSKKSRPPPSSLL